MARAVNQRVAAALVDLIVTQRMTAIKRDALGPLVAGLPALPRFD
jgi:hypothetical protein